MVDFWHNIIDKRVDFWQMIDREAKSTIQNWLKESKKALLVTGARQVGKTFLIRQCIKESGIDSIEINLLQNPNITAMIQRSSTKNSDLLLNQILLSVNKPLDETGIIFIDEVQECPEIITMVKFFVEKKKYKFVLSGSLLGIELKDIRSFPVGYLEILTMYPLTLKEFLLSNKVNNSSLDSLKTHFINKTPIDEDIHRIFMDLFYRYLIIGGMPEAVDVSLHTSIIQNVMDVHKSIIETYKKDFSKYDQNNKMSLLKTYDILPSELNSHSKRFTYTALGKNERARRYSDSFNWLVDAGVALPTYNVKDPVPPLLASEERNLFKLFCSDVGLLTSMYGNEAVLSLLDNGKAFNFGAVFENFVAQELTAKGFHTYYWTSKKYGEIDFLIEKDLKCLPIEVKSGKAYKRHSALSNMVSNGFFDEAFVLCNKNIIQEGKICYYPIYMTMFIEEKELPLNFPIIDLSHLN